MPLPNQHANHDLYHRTVFAARHHSPIDNICNFAYNGVTALSATSLVARVRFGVMGRAMVTTVDDEASIPQNERALLAETLTQWNRLFWWAGVRPMMQRMVEADLTLAESIVLRSLRRGPLTVAQAGACLMLSHSAASRAVDRLVRDGYLAREENPDDRRQKRLTLAPRGEALLGEMEGIMVERLAEMIDVLDADESAQFRSLLTRILTRSTAALTPTGNPLACQEGPFALVATPETDNPTTPQRDGNATADNGGIVHGIGKQPNNRPCPEEFPNAE